MEKALIKNNYIAAFIIFILSILIYIPSINNDFVWDDVIEIQKEYHKFKDRSFFKSLIPKSFKNKKRSYYRTVAFFSIYYDYSIWGNNSFGFHLTNIIINGVCSVLVFFLFLMILQRFGIRARENIALFSALLFTVHPMHVESVSWIAGRTDILCSMFFLSAFIMHIKSYNKTFYIIFACIFFYLSLLSKELAAAFPFTILAFELLSNKRLKRKNLTRISAYFFLFILYLVLRYRFGGVLIPDVNNEYVGIGPGSASPDKGISVVKYITVLKTMLVSYLFYFYKLVTPFWLSSFISEIPKNGLILLLSIVSFALLGYTFIFSYLKRSGFKAFCILWLLLVLGPSVIVSVSQLATTPLAERYLYLPLAPFSLIAVFLLFKVMDYRKLQQPFLIITVLVIILFAFLTIFRQAVWQDRISFWRDAAKNTNNSVPHINLGMALIDNNSLDEGIEILENSLYSNLRTSSLMKSIALNNLGIGYLKKGDTPRAKQVFLDAIEENKGFYKSYYHLGIINLSRGLKKHSPPDLEVARKYFLDAIKLKKNYARAYLGLAKIYVEYGETAKAKELAKTALKYGLVSPMDQQAQFILNMN